MKLLKQYYNLQKAEQESFRLESVGILTFISSETAHRMGAYATGAFKVGLWAVLENQYEDAKRCLADSSYMPPSGLTASEIEELKVDGASEALNTMVKASGKIFVGILATFILIYYSYNYWKGF